MIPLLLIRYFTSFAHYYLNYLQVKVVSTISIEQNGDFSIPVVSYQATHTRSVFLNVGSIDFLC